MVLLPNSGELATQYAPYILELQEFFALHDLRCGSPRELGFLAARLSGRDSFPAELASMVRSFIFREGGSVPLPDLLAIVALAIGGPAVADFASGLQHPLADISSFLASVARAPRDQPPSAAAAGESEADDAPEPVMAPSFQPSQAAQPYATPPESPSPFLPPLSSAATLAPATRPDSRLRSTQPDLNSRVPGHPAGGRGRWVALAVGLPLVLLGALLFHQLNPATNAHIASPQNAGPELNRPLSAPPASISSSLATPQTPLASATAALAQPNSPGRVHSAVPSSSAASPSPSYPSPAARPAGLPAARPVGPAPKPEPPPTLASTSSSHTEPPSPAAASPAASRPPQSPSRAAPAALSRTAPSVTAQQGAFGISSGIMSSHLLSFSPPKYPKMADFTHAEGEVILQAVVSKSGRVIAAKSISGPRTLRKAAEKAVRQWRYRPYVADGRAADVSTIITIDFKSHH